MSKNYIVPIEMQSIDASTVAAGAFTAIKASGVEGACSFIRITNASNTDIIISFNGVDDHEYIPSNKSISTYFQVSKSPASFESKMSKKTVIYARGAAGVGYVYVSGYYNE